MELYKKHRPRDFASLIGQGEAAKMLEKMVKDRKVPHALLLTGPSGTGKTTVARILKKELNCSARDFVEMDAASDRGIDAIREIQGRMMMSPFGGEARIWLLDEVHMCLGPSQNAMLKMLEDTPSHVYFILATTDPRKLLPTIRTRCTEIKFKSLSESDLNGLIARVVKAEGTKVTQEVADRIVEAAEGSARKALVLLEACLSAEGEDAQLELIQSSDSRAQGIELCRALMNPRCRFADIAKIIKAIDEEPESVRRMVLGYFTTVMLSGKSVERCAHVLRSFQYNLYDSGRAGLALACYEATQDR